MAVSATTSYEIDTNWYADSPTDHITSDLDKLSVCDKYGGNEQVHTASGSGMEIQHIGNTTLHTPSRDLVLKDVLHVPSSSKNLVSVHCLALDNHIFLELHPWHFLIKDQEMRKVLHHGRVEKGLYPLKSFIDRQALSSSRVSFERWHHCLGHPSPSIVQRVLKNNNLPVDGKYSSESVCDACLQGNMHQLPYPKSSSMSKFLLELVFSDVWGPTPESVGRFKYYVSFIDDSSKFTSIYLIKHKSEVFQCFHDFQNLVERMFDRKILAMQMDWGGEYQKLNSFFQRIDISHHVSSPHVHQQNGSAERKHRHIVEVGLTLLAKESMPLKFWDGAFRATVHHINHTPSKVLQFDTPLERLFNIKPNYPSLRVFGNACWPNLRPFNNHKLQFRSKRCVFLGFSHQHKGFKCLETSTRRVYIL
jgi:hypothetical protein